MTIKTKFDFGDQVRPIEGQEWRIPFKAGIIHGYSAIRGESNRAVVQYARRDGTSAWFTLSESEIELVEA